MGTDYHSVKTQSVLAALRTEGCTSRAPTGLRPWFPFPPTVHPTVSPTWSGDCCWTAPPRPRVTRTTFSEPDTWARSPRAKPKHRKAPHAQVRGSLFAGKKPEEPREKQHRPTSQGAKAELGRSWTSLPTFLGSIPGRSHKWGQVVETRQGWAWDARTHESLTKAYASVPHKVPRSKSLCPAPPADFPPKRLPRFEAGPPRPLGPSPRAAAPSRSLAAGRSRTQAGFPDTRFRRPASLPSTSRAPPPPRPRGSRQRPCPPSGCPFPRLQRRVSLGTRDAVSFLPAASPRVPTWRGPRPWPFSSASCHLSSPPGPAPLPGGYSLKPLRISRARSSLADMMRQPAPAALPRWPGGASQMMPRNRRLSRSRAWRPRASSGSSQTRTGFSLPSAPAPDPFSFPVASECPPRSQ